MAAPATPVQVDGSTMSFEDYLVAYDGVHAEWVDGRVYVTGPGNEPQGRLSRFLASIIQYWADPHAPGETYVNAYPLRLSEETAREPDVFFIRAEHADRAQGTFVDGAADLVIEVVSPSTRAVDRGVKYYEYEQAGVPEYWLVDPLRAGGGLPAGIGRGVRAHGARRAAGASERGAAGDVDSRRLALAAAAAAHARRVHGVGAVAMSQGQISAHPAGVGA
jgi:Uma2 family endonuclease